MECKMTQKLSEDSRNEFMPKACDTFKKCNREVTLTPWKQRNGIHLSQSTSPSSVFKIKNPFERGIVDRLHMSFCSPTVFISKKKISAGVDNFEWTIDEISQVNPANIELCNSQFQMNNDPIVENDAQKAIDNFFGKDHIVLSPELNIKTTVLPTDNAKRKVMTTTSSTQTEMTIPPKVSREVENMLNEFCTYTYDQQEHSENLLHDEKSESLMKKLFQDEQVLPLQNEQTMDSSALSPVPQSPATSIFMYSHSKWNHGTPTLYNILSPSSVSPIQKKTSPLQCSSISPINKFKSRPKNPQNTMISISKQLPQKVISESYGPIEKNKIPFCQSTPEKVKFDKENLPRSVSVIQNNEIRNYSSPIDNQYYKDFHSNFTRNKSINKLQFTEDMSVDSSKIELENNDSPVIIEKATSVFKNDIKDFVSCNIGAFENGLVPLSPMQTSQMETPLKKRSASAKNLSRSFGLPQDKDITDMLNEESSVKVDSGFTETFNNVDTLASMTKYEGMHYAYTHQNFQKHCLKCNNTSKFNIYNSKCNFCFTTIL